MSTPTPPFTSVDSSKRYNIDTDLTPYLKLTSRWHQRELISLPNLEPLTHADFIQAISYHQMNRLHGHLLSPTNNISYWGVIYWDKMQSGLWDGSGYVAIADAIQYKNPYCGRFFLCKHTPQLMPTAKPERGFHDQFCTKCGIDLSVDSSD